ncbi:MAG: sodium-dependent transporter [Clostridia bacterium]|nr:sodium-dependent transporter [Clostridia bacterium]
MAKKSREQWGSKIGFILAAAGSTVGLGNIWRFSYVAGNEGGAAFVLIYLGVIFFFGYPLLCTEIAIGRTTQKNPVGAFKALAPNSPWWLVGALSVLTSFFILSYYSVIAGWSLSYTFKALLGAFTPGADFAGLFVGHISQIWEPIIWHAVFMLITLTIIGAGVVNGIQRVSKVLMPLLFILLILLVVRGLTLDGAGAGIDFYLSPDFSKVDGGTFSAALGQAFYTLSLGMAIMITYGSYLNKEDNIGDSSRMVIGLDTMVAILAGLAIFPAVFAFGFEPNSGPGLAFITLPAVFASMPLGAFFGFLFFLLLSIAALTSTISLLEPSVSYLIDEKGWERKTASLVVGTAIFLVGIPASLGYSVLSDVSFLGLDLLDSYDFITNAVFLPIGGLLTSIFAGYVWGSKNAAQELNTPPGKFAFGKWYEMLLKYIIPAAILVVLFVGLYAQIVG